VRTTISEGNLSGLRAGVDLPRKVVGPLLLAVWVMAQPLTASAQADLRFPVSLPASIQWWHGAVVLGGLSAFMLFDQPSQGVVERSRSTHSNNVAGALRHFGQPEVYGTVTLGLLGAGLIGGNDEITRAGGRLAVTLALAGLTSSGLKLAVGRPRPHESSDADEFSPFSGQEAMPSGHTAAAFAMATALADDLNHTWASVGLYTLATGVGWSRMNDNKHWLTDIAAGAVIGVSSAKLVNGRWRIFNLRPPAILLGPRQAGLTWQVSF
jgi:membrane-associated phospholipid phosphatase